VDELPFLEANRHQLAVDLSLNGDRGKRRHRSEARERLIDLPRGDLRGADRLDVLCCPLLRRSVRREKTPRANPDDRSDEQDNEPSEAAPSLRGLCRLGLSDARKDGLFPPRSRRAPASGSLALSQRPALGSSPRVQS
jgi:hypothetical protein